LNFPELGKTEVKIKCKNKEMDIRKKLTSLKLVNFNPRKRMKAIQIYKFFSFWGFLDEKQLFKNLKLRC